MPNGEPSPLLRLPQPRTLSRKKRKPSFPKPPDRIPSKHAADLRKGADLVRQHLIDAGRRFPQLATDVPYVRVELARGALISDDELKSIGLIPVYRREEAVLAAYSPECDLHTLDSQISSYASQRKKLAALAKIDSIKAWTREDRTSPRLLKLGRLAKEGLFTVDLLLLPIEGEPANPQALPAIERFVAAQRGHVVDRALEPTFTALRVRLGGQSLNDLLDYRDDVALVDLPPAAHLLVPEVMSLDLDAIEETPQPPAGAPAICVVDSGIVEGHPLLENAVLADRSRSFPDTLGPPVPAPPVDGARHGWRDLLRVRIVVRT